MASARPSSRLMLVLALCGCGARSELSLVLPPVDAGPLPDASDASLDQQADGAPDAPPAPRCDRGTLVTGVTNPSYLALDSTDLYFIDDGSPSVVTDSHVGRCPRKAPCTSHPPELLTGAVPSGGGLTLNDTSVFWTELGSSDSVRFCTKASCSPGTLFVDGNDAPIFLLADGPLLDILSYHAVETCPTGGSTAPSKITMLTYGGLVLVADATTIYFSEASPQGAPRGTVKACAKPDCAGGPRVIATSLPGAPWGLVVDDTNLYVSVGGAAADPDDIGFIGVCPKSGCSGAPTRLVEHLAHPTYLVSGGDQLFWIEDGSAGQGFANGRVASCPKAGCGGVANPIASGQYLPGGIVADTGCVYWSTSGDPMHPGTIQQAPTP